MFPRAWNTRVLGEKNRSDRDIQSFNISGLTQSAPVHEEFFPFGLVNAELISLPMRQRESEERSSHGYRSSHKSHKCSQVAEKL
jgi:hypothetical protein